MEQPDVAESRQTINYKRRSSVRFIEPIKSGVFKRQSKDSFTLHSESIGGVLVEEVPWAGLTTRQKAFRVYLIVAKTLAVIGLLYAFICALDLLSIGFQVAGGPEPRKLFESRVLSNPIVGLMCGILFTIIVQSSSTTSSAVVGMVAGKIITVQTAIPIIMGANIGTSVTNTLVAMLQVDNRDRFRLAFAAGTVHDMFNWLTTLVLLPVEVLTGYLYYVTQAIVLETDEGNSTREDLRLLKVLTDPLTKRIVNINKTVTERWSDPNETVREFYRNVSGLAQKDHLFAGLKWGDKTVGTIVIVLSFLTLLLCLAGLVKVLNSLLKGKIALWIRKTSTASLPNCPRMTDYLVILMGGVLTFLVQSSSVFTSTLPPLVAMRVLSIERAYSLTLGSNIGTTTTALIAAMAQTQNFREGLQIALCHTVFNLTGLLLFFPIPWTRFPIGMAKFLGNTTARYRWFAIVYVVVFYILLPAVFMGLAFAGTGFVVAVATIMVTIFLFVVTINALRIYPRFLPQCLHTWNWLPEWMRSLQPYDRQFSKCKCCRRLQNKTQDGDGLSNKIIEGRSGRSLEIPAMEVQPSTPSDTDTDSMKKAEAGK